MLINFFGKRGSGKTTVIRGTIKYCRPPVVIIDILGNFDEFTMNKAGIGSIQVDKISDAINFLEKYSKKEVETKVVVLKTSDPDLAVDFMSAALWENHGGTLVLDEVDGFSFANAPCFDQLVRYGRNRDVDLITGCRRPAEVSRNITAGANKIFVFQTQEPRDIDYFQSTVLGQEAEKLINIPKFHGLYTDYDSNQNGSFKIDVDGNIYLLS